MRRPTEEILARLTIRAWCAGTLLERTDADMGKPNDEETKDGPSARDRAGCP